MNPEDIAEQNNFYFRKRKEICDQLLGEARPYPVPDRVTTRIEDTGSEVWYNKPRVLPNMSLNAREQSYIRKVNEDIHQNGGKIVSMDSSGLEEAVPPPMK